MWENEKYYHPPKEAAVYNFTLAGHTHASNKTRKLEFLKHENGNLMKPCNKNDARFIREIEFYTNVFKNSKFDPVLKELQKFVPSFHGTWSTTINNFDITYLCIEDVLDPLKNPSVLDVKVGAVTYSPIANEAKIKEETEKYPFSTVLGFRILGMKVYDNKSQTYIVKGKDFGKRLMPENIQTGFQMYFTSFENQINYLILSGFIHKLLQIKLWFSIQRKYAFYSSSILFAYDGNISSWTSWLEQNDLHIANMYCKEEDGSETPLLHNKNCDILFSTKSFSEQTSGKTKCSDCKLDHDFCRTLQEDCSLFRVSMIDFAHVFPSEEEDDNYVFGLNNLIENLKLLLNFFMEKCL